MTAAAEPWPQIICGFRQREGDGTLHECVNYPGHHDTGHYLVRLVRTDGEAGR